MNYKVTKTITKMTKTTTITATPKQTNRYEIVSAVAYLAGVMKRVFDSEGTPPKLEVYEMMNQDKNARTVRNLSIIRTAIMRNFGTIKYFRNTNFTSVKVALTQLNCDTTFIVDAMMKLEDDGVKWEVPNGFVWEYEANISRMITERIDDCRKYFPEEVNWSYIKGLFLLEEIRSDDQETVKAIRDYRQNRKAYPYQVFLNWEPVNEGNILYHDSKFLELLYAQHGDVYDPSTAYKNRNILTKFLLGHSDADVVSTNAEVLVDCENVDPYKLISTLRHIPDEARNKIGKMILFDDVHTANTWRNLEKYTDIPVEHVMIERVNDHKSLTDIMLTARAVSEYCAAGVDSFMLASSDSDFWGLIQSLPHANFMILAEEEKFGQTMMDAAAIADISVYFMEEAEMGDVREDVLKTEVESMLKNAVKVNLVTLMREALTAVRMDMSADERRAFAIKYLQDLKVVVDEDANMSIAIG